MCLPACSTIPMSSHTRDRLWIWHRVKDTSLWPALVRDFIGCWQNSILGQWDAGKGLAGVPVPLAERALPSCIWMNCRHMDYISLKIHMAQEIKGSPTLTKYLADLKYSKCFLKACMQLGSRFSAVNPVRLGAKEAAGWMGGEDRIWWELPVGIWEFLQTFFGGGKYEE